MRDIRVTCPACNTAFDVPADKIGESVECPDCLEPVKVEKSAGPKIQIVLGHGLSPGKRSKKGKPRRDDDDDDYEHDRRDDDDDDDYEPRRGGGGYGGGPSAAVPLTLGIFAVLLACVPPVSIILALAAIRTGHPNRFPNPDSRGIAGFGRTLGWLTFGLYVILIGVAYYMLRKP